MCIDIHNISFYGELMVITQKTLLESGLLLRFNGYGDVHVIYHVYGKQRIDSLIVFNKIR